MKHFKKVLACGLLTLSTISLVNADDFNPKNCSALGEVTVPYKVAVEENQFTFSNDNVTIEVKPNSYSINNVAVNFNDYSGYFDALSLFFNYSNEYSKAMKESKLSISDMKTMTPEQWQEFAIQNPEDMAKHTEMCRVLLDLSALNNLALVDDNTFVAGVIVHIDQ